MAFRSIQQLVHSLIPMALFSMYLIVPTLLMAETTSGATAVDATRPTLAITSHAQPSPLEAALQDQHLPPPVSAPLKPFVLTYTAKYAGLPFRGSATRVLSFNSVTQQYRLMTKAKGLFMNLKEEAHFQWDAQTCQSQPISYHHDRGGIGKDRWYKIEFDQHNNTATYHVKEGGHIRQVQYNISEHTSDRLTEQMVLRCLIMQGAQTMNIEIARKDTLTTHTFKRIGYEQLTTPIGKFDTIKIARVHDDQAKRTLLWFAPELNHWLVRIDQFEKNKHYSVRLSKVETGL